MNLSPSPSATDSLPKPLTIGHALFSKDYLLQTAKASGFQKRLPRKIDAPSLLAAVCAQCIKGSPSCNDLAASLDSLSREQGPSRQAVSLRMDKPFEKFLEQLLADVIACRLSGDDIGSFPPIGTGEHFAGFSRVLVQDSTIIKLPAHLFDEFSGVSNATSSVCNARVQATYDLVSGHLVRCSIDSYSKNDLAAASELLLEAGDLVLRDRGYFGLNEIKRHRDAKADCIYRHKTGTTYLDPETLAPIDLPQMLRCCEYLDLPLLLNNAERTPIRLVAAPVDAETASLRRMKAKKETKGRNPSKAVLELMDWTILITTIAAPLADFQRLLAIYGLRWRIEVIFKAWKSHMNFDCLHRVSKSQMIILLKARLLLITCCTNILLGPLDGLLRRKYQRHLSLLKLIKFFSAAPVNILRAFHSLSHDSLQAFGFCKALLRYCCYDRRKRLNFAQTWNNLA